MINRNNMNTINNSYDPQFSGLLPHSTNRRLLELSRTSNEINLFNTSRINYEVSYFFRQLTRTKEEISLEDNLHYFERIYNYLLNQRENLKQEATEIFDILSPINSQIIQYCIILLKQL
jgi:hypothetical protein